MSSERQDTSMPRHFSSLSVYTISVTNILTGIFVEHAFKNALPDRDQMILEERRRIVSEAEDFKEFCQKYDKDGKGTISYEDFHTLMHDKMFVAYMSSVGLDVKDADMFFNMIRNVSDGGSDDVVDIDQFVLGCLMMRGSATALDMQALLAETKVMFTYMMEFQRHCLANFQSVEKVLGADTGDAEMPGQSPGEAVPLQPLVTLPTTFGRAAKA